MYTASFIILSSVACLCKTSHGFTTSITNNRPAPSFQQKRTLPFHKRTNLPMTAATNEWINILPDHDDASTTSPVLKKLLQEGEGDIPSTGSTVEIEYVGTLGSSPASWTVDDVVESWLKNLQGLYDILAEPMREKQVDGSVLMDEETFTEAFVADELGVANKIQCKKTIMAAKRLRTAVEEYPQGTQFDSSLERGKTYEFVLGKGKAIQGMDLLVATMKVGEKAMVSCRSDFGYGSEGYRKTTGEIVVPPFATLNFEVTLVSAS